MHEQRHFLRIGMCQVICDILVMPGVSVAPRGAPTFTYARNVSSTSVEVAWEPPPRDTINGEFTGYLLRYWRLQTAGRRAGIVKELLLRNDKLKVSRSDEV